MGSLWNRSGIVERYADDIRAAGAVAYFFQGGTTSAMTVYRDAAQGSAHPNPVVADADGRWPDVFVPYVNTSAGYDVQVKTADNVQLTYSLAIPNPNPVDVSVTVPPEQTVQTGMVHAELVNATKAGYVRLNGRTIGNATSGATERANADTVALFTYLYNNLIDGIAPVSGGRTTVAADYAANKTIGLPDMRGATFVGLDDMGNSAAATFTGISFVPAGGSSIVAGSYTGSNGVTLLATNMPVHAHTGTTNADGGHAHVIQDTGAGLGAGTAAAETVGHSHAMTGTAQTITATASTSIQSPQNHTHPLGTGTGTGGAAKYSGSTVQTNTGTFFSADTTTINNTGNQSVDHTHSLTGITAGQSATHTHVVTITSFTGVAVEGGNADFGGDHTHAFTTSVAGGDGSGNTVPFNNLGLSRLVTWFIKL